MNTTKRKAMIALLPIISVLIVACEPVHFFKIDEDVGRLIADGGIILDVRTNPEYAERHIDGAINIPLGKLRTDYVQLDPDRTYVTSGEPPEAATP